MVKGARSKGYSKVEGLKSKVIGRRSLVESQM